MHDIPGYEGIYAVTSCGKVWSYRSNKFLSAAGGKDNYQMVLLQVNGVKVNEYVHRLVAMAYLENPDNLPCVNHKDEHKDHNWVSNLEWCTAKYNLHYSNVWKKLNKPQKAVYCVELDKTFSSIYEASKTVGVQGTSICHACSGKLKTTGGYHWRYAN